MNECASQVDAIANWTGLPLASVERMPTEVRERFLRTIAEKSAEFPKKLEDCRNAWESHSNVIALITALRTCERMGGIPRWLGEAVSGAFRVILYPDAPIMWPSRLHGRGRLARWLTRYKADIVDFARWEVWKAGLELGLTKQLAYDFAADYLAPTRAGKDGEAIEKSVARVEQRSRTEPYRYMLPTEDWWRLYTPPKAHADDVIARYQPLAQKKRRKKRQRE